MTVPLNDMLYKTILALKLTRSYSFAVYQTGHVSRCLNKSCDQSSISKCKKKFLCNIHNLRSTYTRKMPISYQCAGLSVLPSRLV